MKFSERNVYISPNAKLGVNVRVGHGSTIYDNVEIGDNSIIGNDCVIGEPTMDYYSNQNYINPTTTIGSDSFIRSHSIIYAGSSFGQGFSTGHRVTIREFTKMGKNCRVGTVSDIQGYAEFGDHCWLHSNVHIGQKSVIGNFAFIYPYVVLTNDPTPPSNTIVGPIIGDFSQIAVFSVILPGVVIGKHVLIGAGSIVGRNIDDYSLALGSPAKVVKDVRDIKNRESGESHYPWPYRFDRGMPWNKESFDEWLKTSDYKEELS